MLYPDFQVRRAPSRGAPARACPCSHCGLSHCGLTIAPIARACCSLQRLRVRDTDGRFLTPRTLVDLERRVLAAIEFRLWSVPDQFLLQGVDLLFPDAAPDARGGGQLEPCGDDNAPAEEPAFHSQLATSHDSTRHDVLQVRAPVPCACPRRMARVIGARCRSWWAWPLPHIDARSRRLRRLGLAADL